MNLKYVHEDITGSKKGFLLGDAGLQRLLYETPSDSVKLGVSLCNVDPLSQISPDESPMTIRMGAVYTAYKNFKINFDISRQLDSDFRYNLGAEYVLLEWFAFRAGYKLTGDLEGLTMGIGIKSGFWLRKPDLTLDYSATSFGFVGMTHNISMRMAL
jgi:hypothetical protein